MAIVKRKVIRDLVKGCEDMTCHPANREARASKAANWKKKSMWVHDWEKGSFASMWLMIIMVVFSLVIIYLATEKLVKVILWDMVLYYCPANTVIPSIEIARNVIVFYEIFPVIFLFVLVGVYPIMYSIRKEEDVYQRGGY